MNKAGSELEKLYKTVDVKKEKYNDSPLETHIFDGTFNWWGDIHIVSCIAGGKMYPSMPILSTDIRTDDTRSSSSRFF